MASQYLFALAVVTLVAASQARVLETMVAQNPERPRVHFTSNGTFKIVTFTDLHYGEGAGSDWGPEQDVKSTKVMFDILDWERPDFVVFTGDLMSAEVMYPNGTETMDQLLEPVVKGNYKWASTYGNHDIGNNVTREEMLAAEQKYNGSYTQQGEPGLIGTTNFYVPIYPSEDSNDTPALVLWFFDSRGGRNSSGGISAYVHETVVDWFKVNVERMNATWGPVPGLAFFHYPTDPYKPIHEAIEDHPECPGQHDDIVTPQERDTGFMDALLAAGTIRASFVGHNHGNGWCCNYQTMSLCYNRQSGHGGGWKGWMRGSRVLELSLNSLWVPGGITNYIRLENGTSIDYYTSQV